MNQADLRDWQRKSYQRDLKHGIQLENIASPAEKPPENSQTKGLVKEAAAQKPLSDNLQKTSFLGKRSPYHPSESTPLDDWAQATIDPVVDEIIELQKDGTADHWDQFHAYNALLAFAEANEVCQKSMRRYAEQWRHSSQVLPDPHDGLRRQKELLKMLSAPWRLLAACQAINTDVDSRTFRHHAPRSIWCHHLPW